MSGSLSVSAWLEKEFFRNLPQDARRQSTRLSVARVLTTQAAHYQVRTGNDPGFGTVSGQVVDGSSQPVSGSTVTVNRGLFTQTTASTGIYSFAAVPVGTWEIEVTRTGSASTATETTTVMLGMATAVTWSWTDGRDGERCMPGRSGEDSVGDEGGWLACVGPGPRGYFESSLTVLSLSSLK